MSTSNNHSSGPRIGTVLFAVSHPVRKIEMQNRVNLLSICDKGLALEFDNA